MKKLLILLSLSVLLASCYKDDINDLNDKYNQLKTEQDRQAEQLLAYQTLLQALDKKLTVSGVESTDNGYKVVFSDGSSITLTDGNTPVIEIGDNGSWFIDGNDTGIPSSGVNEAAPTIEIVGGNWHINGEDTGVAATGASGSDAPYITSIIDTGSSLIFHMSDSTTITVPKYDTGIVIEDSPLPMTMLASGFYIANEDWFGHDNGTVNYFGYDGSITYRAYRAANPGETFGVTTQFATQYGDYAFFVSKQGNRLVVAKKGSLKKVAAFTTVGGDGRSFLGVNATHGYLGTGSSIQLFNISKMRFEGSISGISGQVGNMCLVNKRAFAVVQGKGVYVINTETHSIDMLLANTSYSTVVTGRDGNVWIGSDTELIKLNPYTYEMETVTLSGTSISSSWGAWNAGSLCASTQQNVLYWTANKKVTRFDIDTKTYNTDFYILPNDDGGTQLSFYGAGVRVDPVTDNLIVTARKSGWGANYSYNWVHIVNSSGSVEKIITLEGDNGTSGASGATDDNYFWFPAVPFFQDVNEPAILVNQIVLSANERKAISLTDKLYDADNIPATMVTNISYPAGSSLVTYEQKQDSLILTSTGQKGQTSFILQVCSNGKTTQKEVRVDIR